MRPGCSRPGLDARDRMSKLCDHLEESGYVLGKDIFLDGFTYFNAQERRVLAILLRQARSVTVTLLGEAEQPGGDLPRSTMRTLEQLGRLAERETPVKVTSPYADEDASALGHLERHFFGESIPYDGRQHRHPAAGGGHRLFRGGADRGGHPPSAGGGEVPLPGHHRGGPES